MGKVGRRRRRRVVQISIVALGWTRGKLKKINWSKEEW